MLACGDLVASALACMRAAHEGCGPALSTPPTARPAPAPASCRIPQAAQLDGKGPLPRLGLAQLSVLQGQPQNAASLLESVLADAPQWIDALEVGALRAAAVLGAAAVAAPPTLGTCLPARAHRTPRCRGRADARRASRPPPPRPPGAGPRVAADPEAPRRQVGVPVQGGRGAAPLRRRALGAAGRPAGGPGARGWVPCSAGLDWAVVCAALRPPPGHECRGGAEACQHTGWWRAGSAAAPRVIARLSAASHALATQTGALKAYDTALEIRRKEAAKAASRGGSGAAPAAAPAAALPARLLNNAAVLHLRAGARQLASELMAAAVAAAAAAPPSELNPLAQVGRLVGRRFKRPGAWGRLAGRRPGAAVCCNDMPPRLPCWRLASHLHSDAAPHSQLRLHPRPQATLGRNPWMPCRTQPFTTRTQLSPPPPQVTLGYNLARVREACGDLKGAEAEYRELLAQFPQYGDCCLRLACIAKARGDTKVRFPAPKSRCCACDHAGRVCVRAWALALPVCQPHGLGRLQGRTRPWKHAGRLTLRPAAAPPPCFPAPPQEALRWTEQAAANPAYAGDALALQAGLHLEKRDYHRAKQARSSACCCSLAV